MNLKLYLLPLIFISTFFGACGGANKEPRPQKTYKFDDLVLEREEKPEDHEPAKASNLPRRPGLPNDSVLPSLNVTNIVTVIQLLEDAGNGGTDLGNLSVEQQMLVLQTLSEMGKFLGLQDVRDWIGLIAMFFVLGPILIPLLMFPVTLIMMGAFMIPLVLNGANVAINANLGRGSASSSKVESFCTEMLSCEFSNFLRNSKWAEWIASSFNLTSISFVGGNGSEFLAEEDCAKYYCPFVAPVQRFFGDWYTHFFTYQQQRPQGNKNRRRINRKCGNKNSCN